MKIISDFIDHIKHISPNLLTESFVHDLCRQEGHVWRQRGILSPFMIVILGIMQTLHGNVSMMRLRGWANASFTASAYCQARKRMPLSVLKKVANQVVEIASGDHAHTWNGLRLFMIDGTCCSMPDTPNLADAFQYPGHQKQGAQFPLAHMLKLVHAKSGIIMNTIADTWKASDNTHFQPNINGLGKGDLLVGDRAFGSYRNVSYCIQNGIKVLFRLHSQTIVDFTERRTHRKRGQKGKQYNGMPRSKYVRKIGKTDQIVKMQKPDAKPVSMSESEYKNMPEEIIVRETQYIIKRKGHRDSKVVLVSTLLDEKKYTKEEIVTLYGFRWNIEVCFRDQKQTLKLNVLKGKSEDVIRKEILFHDMAYNLVRLASLHSAHRQKICPWQISFIDALHWLIMYSLEMLVKIKTLVQRPGRQEPRALKRRPMRRNRLSEPRRNAIEKLGVIEIDAA